MHYGQSENWVIQPIGVNEGLLSPDVWSLYQDQQMFIWVGTEAGVSRFDGIRFQNYTHTEDGQRMGTVKDFAEINGHLVIGSDQGVFQFEEGYFVKCNMKALNVNALCLSKKGILWIGCSDGVHFVQEEDFNSMILGREIEPGFLQSVTKLHDDLRITDIEEKPNGNILISTYYLICEWNGIDISVIWGAPESKPDILSISVSSDDNFHWACDESHFYEYDHGVIDEYSDVDGIPSGLIPYKSGHLLLLVDRLFYFDRKNLYPILETDKSSEWLRKVIIDREGNIWIGTFEGLIKVQPSIFIDYSAKDHAMYSKAYSIAEVGDGSIVFGGNRGNIWTINDGIFSPHKNFPSKLFRTAEVFSIYPDGDITWFSSGYQGIIKVEDGLVTHYTRESGLSDDSRYFFYRDVNGQLWTGGDGGLDEIVQSASGIKFNHLPYSLPNFTYASFLAAADFSENAFFLASTHGLFLNNGKEIVPVEFQNASFSSLHVTDIITDDQNGMWLSTIGEGLLKCRYDEEGKIYLLRKLSREDGLPTDAFLCLLADQKGILWAGSYQGLCRIWKGNNEDLVFRFYDRFDGFPGKSFNHMDLYQAKSGIIWGATTAGIFSLNPNLLRQNQIASTPLITAVQILNANEDIKMYSDSVGSLTGIPVGVRLPYSRNFIRISFTGVSHTKPSGLKFRYKMEGLDESWTYVTNQRSVTFERLPEGDYTFLVESGNEDHLWSSQPAEFSFSIIPAFWNRPWVQVLGVSLSFGLFFQLFRILQKRQLNLQYQSTIDYFANSNYTSNTVSEILWDLARNVISRLQFQDCVVYLLDSSTGLLHQVAAFGPKNPHGREISNPITIPVGRGIVGSAAEQKKPQLVKNTATDPRYIKDIISAGSELAVPILHEGKVLGVIDSEHRKKSFFNKTHVEVLRSIAGHCAHKIASAQANEEMQARDRQLVKIQKEIAESKLTALQAQMNPHFIFNSLNSINWYIVKNRPSEASQYLTKFSRLVRLILDNSKKFTITLKKELETLQLYMDLESMRFEEKFDFQVQTEAEVDLEEVMVPPLILQPFLENAIWHGLMHKKGKGNIVIQIYPENGHLKCIVQDNGIGRKAAAGYQSNSPETHQSKGLKLTTDRIQLMHDEFLEKETVRILDLEDDEGKAAGTRVEIILPYDLD